MALLANTPLPEMLTGNFSSLLAVKPAKQLVDPFTKAAFPGNIIPLTRINSYAAGLVKYYPAPTSPTPVGSLPGSNFTLSETRQETVNEYSIRIDHTFSDKDSMLANYNHFDDPSYEPNNSLCGSALLPKFGCVVGNTTQLAAFSETHIFAPTLINEVRLGFNRLRQPRTNEDNSYPYTPLPGAFSGNIPNNQGVPSTTVSGYATLGGPTNQPQDRADNTFQIIESLSYIKGKHTMKFGVDLRDFLANNLQTVTGRGALSFTASTSAPTTGYALADLLLGYPTSSSRNPVSPKYYQRMKAINVYAQDDYKLASNFTLNIGLRWELNTPLVEKNNMLSNFNPITGTIVVAGQGGLDSHVYDFDYDNFGPRVGFAWQPFGNAKTVVRAGFGMFYQAPVIFNSMNGLSTGVPFRAAQTFNSSIASPVTLDNPFPAANVGGTTTFSGLAKNYGTAEINQWNFNLQRELGFDSVLSLGYYASNGVHIPLSAPVNQPLPIAGQTTAQVNARRPYPTYGNLTLLTTEGNSSFNSLQGKLEKRLSHGLTALVSYTFGKSIDNTPGAGSTSVSSKGSPQSAYNLQAERGLSDFDVRNRLVISPVYNLPFGPGREFLSKGLLGEIIGGWEVSGIVTWQTGHPITPYVSANISNTFNNSDRPNVVGDPNAGPKTVQQWFNTAAFVLPAAGTFGNSGRNVIAGPGLVQADISLARNFLFKEKIRLQFRAEAFNALNKANFNLPAATIDSGSFGQITSAADPRQIQLGLKLNF